MALLRRKPKPAPAQPSAAQPVEPIKPKAPEKTVLTWQAPSRPYKKRNKEYYTTIASIVFLVAVILLFLKEWLLIAVIISLAFVSYVLASVKPQSTEHTITTWGITTGEKKYKWENLVRFWFTQKFSSTMLHVDTNMGFPRQLIMLVDGKKGEIEKIMQKYVTFEKPARKTHFELVV